MKFAFVYFKKRKMNILYTNVVSLTVFFVITKHVLTLHDEHIIFEIYSKIMP